MTNSAPLDAKTAAGKAIDLIRVLSAYAHTDARCADDLVRRGLDVEAVVDVLASIVRGESQAIEIAEEGSIDSVRVIEVDCSGYEAFKALPAGIKSSDGKLLGKSGWNSDRGRAYYREDCSVAFAEGPTGS